MEEDENYHIRRDEWQEVRETVKRIERAVDKFLEREKASDAAINRAQSTADKALEVAYDAHRQIIEVRSGSGTNTKVIDWWQGIAAKVIGGLILCGIAGAIGYMVAG